MDTIFRSFRQKVSADKNRFTNDDYDLDLTYITSRIIAMAYPAEGMESAYRNDIDEVSRMLRQYHRRHFMLYNLSNRPYDIDKFQGLVVEWCGFPDHHPPPLHMLFQIIYDIDAWLQSDPENVVVVHCLAGKGRTGTIIAAYFMYSGLFDSDEEACNFFAYRRSHQVWGVTGPSQLRYIQYAEDILLRGLFPSPEPVMMTKITLTGIPRFPIGPGEKGCTPFFEIYLLGREAHLIFSSEQIDEDIRSFPSSRRSVSFYINCPLRGDVLIHFKHVTPLLGTEPMCHFVFHTGMITNHFVQFQKHEIEKASKDPRFPSDFSISLTFQPLTREVAQDYQNRFVELLSRREGSTASDNESQSSIGANAQCPLNLVPSQAQLDEEQRLWRMRKSTDDGAICFSENIHRQIEIARDVGSPVRGNVSVKGGWLTKRGHKVKNWKRRWFVLKGTTLAYYKAPRELKSVGVIPLTLIREIRYEEAMVDDRSYCFEIVTYQTRYLISAGCERDMKLWASAIIYARNLQLNQGRAKQRVGNVHIDVVEATAFKTSGEVSCTVTVDEQKATACTQSDMPEAMQEMLSFNERMSFAVTHATEEVAICLYDNDTTVGECTISIAHIHRCKTIDHWFDLTPNQSVSIAIHLKIVFEDSRQEMQDAQSILLFESEKFGAKPEEVQQPLSAVHPRMNSQFSIMSLSDSHLPRSTSSDVPPPPSYPAPPRPEAEEDDTAIGSSEYTITDEGSIVAKNRRSESEPMKVTDAHVLFEGQFRCGFSALHCLTMVGMHLWSGDAAGNVHIWEISTGAQVLCFKAHAGTPIHDMVFDGVNVWTASDECICVWDTNTYKQVKKVKRHKGPITCLAFASGSSRDVWSGSVHNHGASGTLVIWNADNLSCKKQFELENSAVGCFYYADGKMWVGTQDCVLCFDASPTSQIRVGVGLVSCMLLVRNALWLCSKGSSRIFVWDCKNNQRLQTLTRHKGAVRDLIVLNNRVWSTSDDLTILVWDAETYVCIQHLDTPHTQAITCLSPTSTNTVCVSAADKTMTLWRSCT